MPYLVSLLVIALPVAAIYYLHIQNQTKYHQQRAFRALDEVGRLLDAETEAFKQKQKFEKFDCIHSKSNHSNIENSNGDSCQLEQDSVPLRLSLEDSLADIRQRREFNLVALAGPDGDVLYRAETERSEILTGRPAGQAISETRHYENIKHLIARALETFKKQGATEKAKERATGTDGESKKQGATEKAKERATGTDGESQKKNKNSAGMDSLGQAAFVEVALGGTTELVFIQPYRAREAQLFCPAENACIWENSNIGYIVGIVDRSSFDSRVKRVSPNIVAGWVMALLVGLVVLPYLRLVLGGPLSSVSTVYNYYLVSAGIISAGILSILILWGTLGRSILTQAETTAERIATDIEADIHDEITNLLVNYQSLQKEVKISSEGSKQAQNNKNKFPTGPAECPVFQRQHDGTVELPSKHYLRPPYQTFFLVNRKGKLVELTPAINEISCRNRTLGVLDISDRQYFKLALTGGPGLNRIANLPPFAIQSIRNYSDSSLAVALGIPDLLPTKPAENGELDLRVGVISGPLQSLSAPVLPPGFQFAIVENASGKVVGHSNPSRVLVEDLFREVDDDPDILASIKGRQGSRVDGRYHGNATSFHLRPIRDLPWSVVVMHDRDKLQMVRFQIALVASAELIAIFLILSLCMLFVAIFWHRAPWVWVWPLQGDRAPASWFFWGAPSVLMGVVAVGIAFIFYAEGWFLIWGTAVIVLAGSHLLYLLSAQPFDVRFFRNRRFATPALFVLASMFLLPIIWLWFSERQSDDLTWAILAGLFGGGGALLIFFLAWIAPKLIEMAWLFSPEKEPFYSLRQRNFRHISAGVCCLLLFGGLPGAAGFKDAYFTHMDLLYRQISIDTAGAFDRRVGALQNYIASLDKPKNWKEGTRWTEEYDFYTPAGVYSYPTLYAQEGPNKNTKRLSPGYSLEMPDNNTNRLCPERTNEKISFPNGEGTTAEGKLIWEDALASFFVHNLPGLNENMARLHLAGSNRASDGRWFWASDKKAPDNQTTGQETTSQDDPVALFYKPKYRKRMLEGDTVQWMKLEPKPSVFERFEPEWYKWLTLAVIVTLGIFVFQIRVAAARLVGTRISPVSNLMRAPAPNKYLFPHRMILRSPGWRSWQAKKSAATNNVIVLKLDEAGEDEFNNAQREIDSDEDTAITILNLPCLIEDIYKRQKVLPLLEELVGSNPKTKITIFADHNPLYRLTQPEAYGDVPRDPNRARTMENLRWASLLAGFVKEYAWYPSADKNWVKWKTRNNESTAAWERETRIFRPESKIRSLVLSQLNGPIGENTRVEDIVALVEQHGGAYYRKLWEECTHNERVILENLASGRCVNTLNFTEIKHLMRRGLITMEPSLTIVNDSFTHFIRDAESPETFAAWQAEEWAKGLWPSLRVPFMFLLFVPIAVLAVTATQQFEAALALIMPIVGAVPLILRGVAMRETTGS